MRTAGRLRKEIIAEAQLLQDKMFEWWRASCRRAGFAHPRDQQLYDVLCAFNKAIKKNKATSSYPKKEGK